MPFVFSTQKNQSVRGQAKRPNVVLTCGHWTVEEGEGIAFALPSLFASLWPVALVKP